MVNRKIEVLLGYETLIFRFFDFSSAEQTRPEYQNHLFERQRDENIE